MAITYRKRQREEEEGARKEERSKQQGGKELDAVLATLKEDTKTIRRNTEKTNTDEITQRLTNIEETIKLLVEHLPQKYNN